MKLNSFIFGKRRPADLKPAAIPELLKAARARAEIAVKIPIGKILEILDRTGKIWRDAHHPLRKKAVEILPEMIRFSHEMVEEGLNVVATICSEKSLRKRLIGEFGDISLLDDWVPRKSLLHDLKAVPNGPLLHLAAGNVFVGSVDSLVSGIITKNANILKMSKVDPVFPVLFLESLKEADPEGLVWKNQAIITWKGGDEAIEKPLLGSRLTVVFWGGREALISVRSKIGLGTRLIENGPRYSFAVADGKALSGKNAAAATTCLALDVCRWDQQACSSPHVVYLVGASEKLVVSFISTLESELKRLSKSLPLGSLDFDEKVEIRKARELALMSEICGTGKLFCPDKFDFSIIFEKDPLFKISCLNRTLFVKRVSNVEELLEQIAPLGEYLQTVGLFVSEQTRKSIEPSLLQIGVKRLTEWGGMSEGKEGSPHEGSFMLTRLVDFVSREYLSSEKQTSSEGSLETRIENLLKVLPSSKYYRKFLSKPSFTEAENDVWKRFFSIPLLDKETFYSNSPPISRNILTGPETDAYVYASGGTTGKPKYVLYGNSEYRRATDVLTFIYKTAGLDRSDVVGNLFLAGNLWTSFNVAGRAIENLGCLHLPIGGATDFENLVQYLLDFKVNALVGLPSVIVKLAEDVKKRSIPLKIRKILYGGEHLRSQTKEFLAETLGASWIRSAGYACVDTGPIGFQCPHLEGALHHVLEGYQYVEILKQGETGEFVPCEAGEPGEIVSTNLERLLMPVVRYRTGDMGCWLKDSTCACGFNGKTFELLGRCDDMIVLGAINLFPSDIACGLTGLPVSPNFQIVGRTLHGKDLLVLRLEAEKELPLEVIEKNLRAHSYKLEEALAGNWLNFTVEWFRPGGIPRNPRTGKLKVVVDERK